MRGLPQKNDNEPKPNIILECLVSKESCYFSCRLLFIVLIMGHFLLCFCIFWQQRIPLFMGFPGQGHWTNPLSQLFRVERSITPPTKKAHFTYTTSSAGRRHAYCFKIFIFGCSGSLLLHAGFLWLQ